MFAPPWGNRRKRGSMNMTKGVFDPQNRTSDVSVDLNDVQGPIGQTPPLSLLLQKQADLDISRAQTYGLDPDNPENLHAYLRCVRDIGDVKKCVELLEQAIALAPQHCGLELQLLWNINYLPGYDRAYLFERARQWAERHVAEISESVLHNNPRSLTRTLKVGIVSGDFKENSAMTFYEPALAAINREAFALYAYSNVETPTEGTERFKALFWCIPRYS